MNRSLLLLLAAAPLAGCQSFDEAPPPAWGGGPPRPAPEPSLAEPDGSPAMAEAAAATTAGASANAAPAAPASLALDLEQALRLAAARAPELGAGQDLVHAAEARRGAAGSLPDPELSLGVEAVPFSSPRDGDEFLAGLSQEVPLSSAGAASRGLAESQRELAEARREVLRLQLETRVRGAFAQALAAQELVAGLDQRTRIGARLVEIAAARVEHGDLLPSAARALQAGVAASARALQDARVGEKAAKNNLSDLIGAVAGAIGPVEGELSQVLAVGQMEALLTGPAALPVVSEALAEAELARWRVELAEARTLPSVELGLAYRRRGDGRDSFDAGLAFELPIQGRRSAEARAARFEQSAARQRAAAVERDAVAAFRLAHAGCRNALDWLALYDQELLPAAEAQLEVAEARAAAGDLSRAGALLAAEEVSRLRVDRLEVYAELLSAWSELRAALVGEAP